MRLHCSSLKKKFLKKNLFLLNVTSGQEVKEFSLGNDIEIESAIEEIDPFNTSSRRKFLR